MKPSVGLSYEQGPALGLPLGFFQTAASFLFLAATLAALDALWVGSSGRWSPTALAITHLVTLGYLAITMLGALLQMLPVLLGVSVHIPPRILHASRYGISIGTLLLALGLYLTQPVALMLATLSLTLSLAPLLIAVTRALLTSRVQAALIWPFRKAWLALIITLTLGIGLAGALADLWPFADLLHITQLHLAWGLGGWILLLIIGSAYQVVPMLQLTAPYPDRISRGLTWALLAGLIAISMDMTRIGLVLSSVAALGFALTTLWLQAKRRRKTLDETLRFWHIGMISLALCALIVPYSDTLDDPAQTSLGLLFLLGFATSIVNGMIYKILPFLAWFHLRAQTGASATQIPNMKQFIPVAAQYLHYRTHLAAVALLLPTPWLDSAWSIPGWVLLAVSAIQLWRNIQAVKHRFLNHGGTI
jgi:hypothetical protein